MPTPHVIAGRLMMRQWDPHHGLRETPVAFESLDELFAQCLAAGNPEVLDRLSIHGFDAAGQPRVVSFVFQSITVSHQADTPAASQEKTLDNFKDIDK